MAYQLGWPSAIRETCGEWMVVGLHGGWMKKTMTYVELSFFFLVFYQNDAFCNN
jgi:hypothetical protein